MLTIAALGLPDWVWITLQWVSAILGLSLVAGTLLSMTPLSAWWARVWDFPRLQIAVAAPVCAAVFTASALLSGMNGWSVVLVVALGLSTIWQLYRIRPYTVLSKKQVERADDASVDDDHVLRLVISNVLQTNRDFDTWKRVVTARDPDVVAAAEVDQWWVDRIDGVYAESHPHSVKCPLDNLYGLALWSRLSLDDARVEFTVQDDIPSLHGVLTLRDGTRVDFHCLHPRPPMPPEHNSSQPRDAELVLTGRRIGEKRDREQTPTLVFGDLNDVAWSRTTDLFVKLSRLLDLRRGRGFYNTFNANSRLMRFPLDHIFISPEFRLVEMTVLDHVGSDHFPVSVTLAHEPDAAATQHPEAADAGEQEEASEVAAGVGDHS